MSGEKQNSTGMLHPDNHSDSPILTKVGYDSEESLRDGYTPSMADVDTLHGSQDRLISSAPLAVTPSYVPHLVTSLPNTEQHLIYSLRQLKLTGWDSGDKYVFSMNKTEQEIVDLAFNMASTEQLTEFERSVLAKVRGWQSATLPPLSLATHAQRTFINAIRNWRRTQRPQPFIKRIFGK